jgi:hypothetical protein
MLKSRRGRGKGGRATARERKKMRGEDGGKERGHLSLKLKALA